MRFGYRLACLATVLWYAVSPLSAEASDAWAGKVLRIVDGDSLQIGSADGVEHRIRLYGIDCPEKGQLMGTEATQATQRFTEGSVLEVEELRRDRNGRVVALVTLPDEITLQELLLFYGLAWVDERYCKRPECESWRLLQNAAHLSGRGIWKHAAPIPPWRWRRGER